MSRGFTAIGLTNPKTPANAGAVLRACGCYRASLIIISGGRLGHWLSNSTDTMRTHRHIPVIHAEHILDHIPHGCIPVAVDLLPEATPLPEFRHPERAFYIFGPEDGTLGHDVTERCPHKVYVPTKQCMNLAATVNVVLYDRLAKRPRIWRAA